MNYKITKIEINKANCEKLITKLRNEIDKIDIAKLDKRKQEVNVSFDDGRIDIWCEIEFNSDYRYANGGVECTDRSVNCAITITDSESGDEIDFSSDLFIETEIEKHYSI